MNQWRPFAGGSEHPVITAPPVTQLAFAAAVVGSELVAGSAQRQRTRTLRPKRRRPNPQRPNHESPGRDRERVLAGIAMAVLGGAGVASAHAELLSSDPQPDEVLDTAPAHVTLRFTEPVEISLGAIRLFDGTGNPIDVGTAHHGCAERSRSKPFWPWRSSW